jgi:hypothetical protein
LIDLWIIVNAISTLDQSHDYSSADTIIQWPEQHRPTFRHQESYPYKDLRNSTYPSSQGDGAHGKFVAIKTHLYRPKQTSFRLLSSDAKDRVRIPQFRSCLSRP